MNCLLSMTINRSTSRAFATSWRRFFRMHCLEES